jgi:hypothetical protein
MAEKHIWRWGNNIGRECLRMVIWKKIFGPKGDKVKGAGEFLYHIFWQNQNNVVNIYDYILYLLSTKQEKNVENTDKK